MANATLVTHCGAKRLQDRWELEKIDAPEPTKTWFPVRHATVLSTATRLLNEAGYKIEKEELAVSHGGLRFFGTLNLSTELAEGVCLAVGIRNSNDQTFPMGFCAGNRVFCCDNLAFRSELLVKKKHTVNGRSRFLEAISNAIGSLRSFQDVEAERIKLFRQSAIQDDRAAHIILKAAMQDVIPLRHIPKVWKEYHEPSVDHGRATLWALLNAFTAILGPLANRNPNVYASKTIRLNSLLCPEPLQLAVEAEASHPMAV